MLKWQTIAQKSARQLAGQTHRSYAKLSNKLIITIVTKMVAIICTRKITLSKFYIKITTLVMVWWMGKFSIRLKITSEVLFAGNWETWPSISPKLAESDRLLQNWGQANCNFPWTTTFHTSHQPQPEPLFTQKNEAAWASSSQACPCKSYWSQNNGPCNPAFNSPQL